MNVLLQPVIAWVAQNTFWAGLAVFAVSFSESMAIVGLLIPGVAMMFTAGALITTGALEFWPTFGWAVAGAVAGDGLSFWLGHRFKDRLRSVWPFSRHPEMLTRGEAFFRRYGGKSVAFGRFFGPVRAVIPLVAGMMGMPPLRFLVANVASALVWAPAYLLPGMVLGASLQLASEVAGRLVLLIVLLAALFWVLFTLTRRAVAMLQVHAARTVRATLSVGRLHPILDQITHALGDPQHPEARGLALFALLLLATVAGLALLASLGLQDGLMAMVDRPVLDLLQSLRTPWTDRLFVALAGLGSLDVGLALALVVALHLWLEGHHRTMRHWLAAAAFALVVPPLLHHLLQLPRPPTAPAMLGPYGFPSADVLRATVLLGFLAIVVARPLPASHRWLPYAAATLCVGTVAFAELYLGAHWLSDVTGSLILGVAWLSALGLAYHRHARVELHWLRLSAVSVAALALVMAVRTPTALERESAHYAPPRPVATMEERAWRTGGWESLPARRDDLRRLHGHPLTLQYAGVLEDLEARLAADGWRRVATAGPRDWLRLLATDLPLAELPVLPQVHDGQQEAMVLTRPGPDDRRWVLRLWPARVTLAPGDAPLWIGNVALQERRPIWGMAVVPATDGGFEAGLALLRDALPPGKREEPAAERPLLLVRLP
jgi:undecaprenyl-diphosphatase